MRDDVISISRLILWRYVSSKVKKIVECVHIISIIDILFREITNDLLEGKTIKIKNFGKLKLVDTKSRLHYDMVRKNLQKSEPKKMLKFTLADKIKNKLRDSLDIDKTFPNG